MKHVTSRVLFAYWNALRGERASPERSAIDPGAIRHILADVFILEVGVLGGAPFRIAGTRLCALFGHELKGQRFERLWPPHAGEDARRSVGIVLDKAAGLVSGHRGVTLEGAAVNLETLLLPLRGRARPLQRKHPGRDEPHPRGSIRNFVCVGRAVAPVQAMA